MSKMIVLVLSFLGLFHSGVGQLIQSGQCESIQPHPGLNPATFNPETILGSWYEYRRTENDRQSGDCSSIEFSRVGDGYQIKYSAVTGNFLDESFAVAAHIPGTATFTVEVPSVSQPQQIIIQRTDDTNYAIAYHCRNINANQRALTVWEFLRGRAYPNEDISAIVTITLSVSFGITAADMRPIDHTFGACQTMPVIPPGQPIIVPGSCNTNISVVQNFNVSRFTGLWHETSAYYSEFSQNQCSRAEYTLANGVVQVENSQVVDQTLTITTGTASLLGTDQSGRLSVILNVGNGTVTSELWILGTDYDNYAVSYSCTNLPNNQQRVFSWILSRTRQLTNEAQIAVNSVLDAELVLNERYYTKTDQSSEACFFYPEADLSKPVVFRGQCNPNIPVVTNFNAAEYLGTWRLIESYPNDFQIGTCNEANYGATPTAGTVTVVNSQVINQALATTTGGQAVASADGSGKLQVTFAGSSQPSDLWILATDYNDYSFVYSCRNITEDECAVSSWKMSRTGELSQNASNAINQVMESINVLDDRYYYKIDQSDEACFYFPEADLGRPVRFRGRCNPNVTVVQNFNATRYLGVWHNIELYPSPFQNGACNNALYTLGDDGVVVFNTQVIDQSLDTITGLAVPTNTDGSAILDVYFPTFTNQSIPYWVLATDYDSYSLVYSCVETDDRYKDVWSWKLSRTKQLTPAAVTAINTVVNQVQVLDPRYYRTADQSPEACFYYPEPEPGKVVRFPGRCDNNINVVQNFNLTRFSGIWHEIQAYPKEQQQGQCINHEYSAGAGNTLDLVTSSVSDLAFAQSNGVLSFTSTDGSAKLSINITNSDGQVVIIPFWILDTNYEDYALAYACVDEERVSDQDYRRVFSWKLSRSKNLPGNAITAINNTIATIDVLQDRYYEDIDQTDEGCFFLPEVPPGEEVVFPGRCENIPVVQNFRAADYTGRWFLIESYPSNQQSGTCNDATYTAGANNIINVRNTQVVNQALATASGTAVPASNDGSAKLLVTFGSSSTPSELWILDTDYSSYSLAYSCRNVNNDQRAVWSWKLSRTRQLEENATIAINQAIDRVNVLHNRYYYQIDRSEAACFYFPEPDLNTVRFRGRCNTNITALQNFNATRYLGVWHNIALYPSPFQAGACNNALYTLGDDGVVVFNTQVIDQSLDTITGLAVPVSTDGSAILDVTFPTTNNQTIPYWVLATDYESYSLVYSCVELDEEYTTVWSWILSRTRQLTPAAEAAINTVVNQVQVLDPRYYRTADQSPEACFYYPEPRPGQVVRFPGRCDNNIPVVQNFNLTEFEGVWHEIQAYPKEQQPGQCINHEYSAGASNTLDLVTSSVSDLALSQTSGVLRFTSTDGSAKMSITITNSNGQVITIPFWVLETDYKDYALAYACVDEERENDMDYRRVFSWKLSRSKNLSANAITAINNTIATVDVLRDQYYEDIDQTDEGCFFLPEVPPGEEVVFPGRCENIPVVQNFRAADYTGRWFLIESYPSNQQSGTCNDATYTAGANNVINVRNTQVVNQTLASASGTAVSATFDGSAKLLVTFGSSSTPSELWILDTDYSSYSLAYSCRNVNDDQRAVWSWKLSRERQLSENATIAINQAISRVNVLHNRYYYQIDRSEAACFYFPEPDLTTSVRFRGRCNPNITVVQNFNATRYLGVWHNIELYPSPFQDGACNNALYTLGDDGVVVFNTQVVGQSLDTITGLAVPVSNDGSAVLDVTFPTTTNQTIPYWVLATDYESYSLVYSCVELDEEYTTVWSWKLSRTRQLPTAAVAAINNVVNQVQVLDPRYYRNADQSPQACFYYPEPQKGVVVRFPGRCDNNIPVVQNFNLTQFAGIWHEIQAYPKEQQPGQCISHEYSADTSNTLNLVTSSVSNLTLGQTNGVLRFTSTDNSARLSITITNSNGQVVTIPFWVLDTDYEDYALAYACVDEERENDMDYRRVFSWKLSRSKNLSANAITAIDNTIATVDVLRNQYYEDIDQTDEGCFYLPEVPPGEEVVFPGRCENIPVVQNFRAADYTGRWFLIESYPSYEQTGTCNDATYTAGANNVINVRNTLVVNQTLASVSGTAVISSNDGSGKLLVTFGSSSREIWILDTDYISHSLVYACRNINNDQRAVWSWKLSRTRQLTENSTIAINDVIDRINVLDDRYYYQIDRSEAACFYFPEPDPSTSVRFRGRCNPNISVVQNFNASRYLGVWHNIELYPSPFQEGACNNALYTLGDDGVVVFNTQVIDQSLDTITGLAVPVSTDGSAVLDVTFPTTTNQTIPYWVLATDYESYSLVYSCVELDEEYTTVWSWKLSRTRQLTTTAVAAINNVVNQVQVLDPRYYRTADQSPEACFYYPEPEPGKVVRFPGRCNNNISVEQNFNLTMFEGVWHEIQAYPKEQQQGQCISHEYSAGTGNTLNLVSSSVSDLTLGQTDGVLRFTSTDGSARMSITITNSNGQVITIPFWVLDTDYADYALAYACVDEERVNDMDYRRIFSWKLSRTRSATVAGTAAIDAAINAVDVLDNKYYENVAQTDDACFHLPNLLPGEPAIFPGQCDPNVPVVQNFNASRYLNRWRTIELYHADFQNGECSEATYTQRADGNVDVLNTHVIDQTLFSANGVAVPASDGSGRLEVTFSNSATSAIYWILDTDYDSYALVYTCRNINTEQRRVGAWKLSRDRVLSAAANAAINEVIDRVNVLDNRYFRNMVQSDAACFYYPEADGSPVVFRGLCDNSVNVVSNFNASRYEGTWYDIESYPTGFQEGNCNTATYTLNGGVVEVFNTQVVDQELDTIAATAVPAVADGSAKLIVTFPAGPNATIDVPYWVLDTDYETYSLVYSCDNIDDERRRVTSWKLSRSRYLTNASNAAIDTVLNRVPVLRQQYYLERGHTYDDCFYYPDNFGGPVIFHDGQCPSDDQVNAINNFDADRFTGSWHEVERFPSELQTGACAATTFSIGTNGSSTLTQTVVYNERQQTVEGSAVVSNSGRGIITVRIDNNELDINNNLYVIDTDYDGFALLYACKTLTNSSRQVYSWKLSRRREGLTEAAVNRINAVVRNEVDLHRSYYEPTPQDNDACFYYPVFETLPDSIRMPGPCPSIPAVANFNITAYAGRWYDVERYPQPNQRGTCNRARYAEVSPTSFSVFNYQVLTTNNWPALSTISGEATVTSTDGSGALTVSLQNGQRVRTLSVLDTDYINYAFLYNCRDLDDGWRQVASWKMSRSTSLDTQSLNAINEVINRTQGLTQEYYVPTNQTEEACFFIPAFTPNQRPQLRARCESISGMQQFDINRYQGWWHEYESFATESSRGECVSAQYTASGNTVQYVGTGVFGVTSQVTTGTVSVGANGLLTKTLSNGEVETLWVLDTDYETYSVVISCENVDDEFVRIWSAKYRKTYELTEAIVNATNAVVESHTLLYQHLYQSVNQTDAACFHYPTTTGDRVLLRGQCDNNIPVQSNFEISEYTGTWYQIERYPYPDVRAASTCIGTRYELIEDTGVVSVLNWEVFGGELQTVEGLASVVGNARLQVQIPDPVTNQTSTTDLYILETDYVSYSLAYTCVNVNDFQRAVVAFKLSRSRSLVAPGPNNINALISVRPELHQPYFLEVTQNDDCEEPSSSYLVKSSILLVLLCYAVQMLMR